MIKIKNSENLYPTIFKEHLLLCLLKSSYKEDIIIEDVENITLLTSIIKLNSYTINKFLKEIFNNYKELSFKISKSSFPSISFDKCNTDLISFLNLLIDP